MAWLDNGGVSSQDSDYNDLSSRGVSPLLGWVRSGSVYRVILPVCLLNLEFGDANTWTMEM